MATANTRPRIVDIAILLLWVSLVLGIPLVVLRWSYLTQIPPPAAVLFFMAAIGIFNAWLIFRAAQGQDWARFLNLAFFACAIASYRSRFMEIPASSPITTAIELAQFAAQVTAFVLLFRPTAAAWFRPIKSA